MTFPTACPIYARHSLSRSATTRDNTIVSEGLPRFSKGKAMPAPSTEVDFQGRIYPILLRESTPYLRTMTTCEADLPARLKGELGRDFATLGKPVFQAGSRGDSE